jgi:RHS repeat-associated protein
VGNANLSNGFSAPVADTLFAKPAPGKDISATGFPGLSANLPDLTVRFGSATKDNQAQIVVTNQGNQKAQGQINITVYGSKDPFLNTSDSQLAALKKQSINLGVGQSQTYTINVSKPKKIGGQDYYLLAAVDSQNAIKEINEGNNLAIWNTAVPSISAVNPNVGSLARAPQPINTTLRKTTFWNNTITGDNLLWYTDDPAWVKGLDNNSSTGGIYEALPKQADPANWKFQTTGDFNGDGQTDILWRHQVTGAIQFWAMNGTIRTQTLDLSYALPDANWKIQGAGDFDGDGSDDIIWRYYAPAGTLDTGKNAVWTLQLNPTTGKYDIKPGATGGFYFTSISDLNWEIQGAGDFNADQKPDLIWRNKVSGDNAIWFMNGTSSVALSTGVTNPTTDLNWKIRGSNDFNGDGKSDLLWQNQTTGENAAWYMDSSTRLGVTYLTRIGGNSAWQSYGSYNFYEVNPTVTAGLAIDTAIGGTNTDLVTSDPTITGQVTGARVSNVLKARLGTTQAFTNIITNLPTNGQFTLTRAQLQQLNGGIALADGTYTLQLQAQDIHLNASSITSLTFTLDSQAPTIGSTIAIAPTSDTGLSNSDGITSQKTPIVTGTAQANATVQLFDGAQKVGQATASVTGAWQITPTSTLADGVHSLTAKASDVAGNTSAATTALTVKVDSVAPTLALTSNFTNATLSAISRFTGTLTDPGSGVASVKYRFGTGGDITVPVATDGKFDQVLNFAGAPTGATNLTVTGTDIAGNAVTSIYSVIVPADISSQPKVVGQVIDDRGVSSFQAQLGTNPAVTVTVAPGTGNFVIDLKALNNNVPLALGTTYSVGLKATDTSNNLSAPQSIQVYLIDPTKAISIPLPNSNGTVGNGNVSFDPPNTPNGPKTLAGQPYTGPISIQQTPEGAIKIDLGTATCAGFKYTPSVPPISPLTTSSSRPPGRYDYKLYSVGGSGGGGGGVAIGAGNFDNNGQLVINGFGTGAGLTTGTYLLAPDYVPVKALSEIDSNPDENCVACRARKQFNADASVELHSGAVLKNEELVSYQSKDQSHTWALSYNSLRADARPIVHFGYENIGTNIKDTYRMTGLLKVKTGGADIVSSGYTTDLGIVDAKVGENYWKLPSQGGPLQGALQVDMRGQASGVYDYDLETGIKVLCGCKVLVGDSTTLRDKLVVVNGADSDFGTGWGLTGLEKIYETTTRSSANGPLEYNALVVDGSGDYVVFRSVDGVNYASASGDFSYLTKQSGKFSRTTKDGVVYAFNTDNQMISATDRNGQVTQMVYDAATKRLVKIVDNAGLETKFTYGSTGKIESITDPANRITQLTYDTYTLANGQTQYRLKTIKDPDTFTRSFGYTANAALLTSDTDKRNKINTIIYDDLTGRAKQAKDRDTLAITNISAAQIQGVRATSETKDPNSMTLPTALTPELTKDPFTGKFDQVASATYKDPAQTAGLHNGSSTIYLSRSQEEIYSKDEFGTTDVVTRNSSILSGRYLPSSVTDARGQQVSYRYDSNGNITQVSDLLANGTTAAGSFFPNAELPGSFWDGLAVDWNGDGKVDLISKSFPDAVTVSYGNGKGLFSAPVKLANYASYIAVGDLDRDGRLDLVTADSGNSATDKIRIYLSNTDRTLKTPQEFSKPQTVNSSSVTHLVLADLNGDNAPEIVAMGLGYNSEKWEMTLKNNGTGNFTDPANGVRKNPLNLATGDAFNQGINSSQILVADINSDGCQDVILVAKSFSGTGSKIYTLLGQRDPLPGTPNIEPIVAGISFDTTVISPAAIAVGRFSPPLNNSLIINNDFLISNGSTVQVFAGNGLGSFAAPTTLTVTGSLFKDSMRDVNGDGIIDLVTKNTDSVQGDQYLVSYGTGSGAFGLATAYSTGTRSTLTPIAWGDLDGNGQIDLLLQTPNAISSLLQKREIPLKPPFTFLSNVSAPIVRATELTFSSSPLQTVVGDVNGDWVPDLIALTGSELSVRLNYGDGTYADPFTVGLPGTNQAIAVGDLDGDGSQDVVVANNAGALTIVRSDGRGKFFAPQASLTVGSNPTALTLQDLNGDGKLDLVSTNGASNNVSVLFGNALGGFTVGANYAVGTNPKAMAIGDINGDGKVDIAVANAGSNSVSLLTNNGSGVFAVAATYNLNASPTAIAIGDVNGDGRRDLVVGTGGTTDNLWVFSGQAGVLPSSAAQKYSFGNQGIAAVSIADLDGDGKFDVVTTSVNGSALKTYVQLGGGATFAAEQRYQFNGATSTGMLVLADMDLDGAVDIVTGEQGGNLNGKTSDVVVRLNDRLRLALPGLGQRVMEYGAFNQVTRTVDELGRQTIYELNGVGNVVRSIRVMGAIDSATELANRTGNDLVTDYSYTTDGRVSEMRDALNHVTRYDYTVNATTNAGGNLAQVTIAYGTADQAVMRYEYDRAGNRTASIDEYGNRTTYTYKAGTNLLETVTEADPDGVGPLLAPVTSYLYDANGNRTQVTGPDPDGAGPRGAAVTTYGYDDMNRLRTTTSADPDGAGAQLASVTTYEYDVNGNQTGMVDAAGRRTEMVYDSRDRLTSSLRKNVTGTVLSQSGSLYDVTNNTTGIIDANGKRTNTVYDQRGRRTRSIDALGNVTRFIYDAANQLVAQVDAKGNMTQFIYDDLGRRIRTIDPKGNSTQTIYDKNGNVTARIDENGNRTESRYDNRDRLVRSYDANNTSVPEAARKFTETKYGQVSIAGKIYQQTQIIDPNVNTTTYVYDGLGRLSTDTNQLGKTRTYKYDSVGNQIEVIDRNNLSRTFEYDTLNRQTKENWVGGARSITYQYNILNQLIDVTDLSGTSTKLSEYAYGYDELDRVRSIDNLGIGGVARVALTYAYDDEGNIKSLTDTINGATGGAIAYDYDALNRATQITQSGTGITNKRVKLTYNAVGQMETLQRLTGTTFTQSVATTTYGYNDPLNRLTQIQHANATGTTLSSFAFTYDSGSRIKKIQNADGTFVNYDYASNNELKAADYSPVARVDEAYTYDANGNRTNAGYVTGSNNQLSADGKYAYTYDDEGNLKTRRDLVTNVVRTFNWDYRNRLTSVVEGAVTVASYTYDANNQRVSKTTGGVTTRYVYDRGNVTMEFNGAGTTPTVRYLYGMQVDQILAQDKGNGNVSWDLMDQLGSVRALVGNDGVLRNRYEYDAFGSLNSSMVGATDDSRYRYTGREFDAETGLHYYRARYFDSNSGRFIGQDPIGFDAGDSNLYRYVRNNSVNLVDPTGLYGMIVSQSRDIVYRDSSGKDVRVDNISDVISAVNLSAPFAKFSYIVNDTTEARLAFFEGQGGSSVSKSARAKVPDMGRNDDAGHIVGNQLGGSGLDPNNLFAQNKDYNRGYDGKFPQWRKFEDEIRKQIDYEVPFCNCHPTVDLSVKLWYNKSPLSITGSLRPVKITAYFVTRFRGKAIRRGSTTLQNP